MEPIPYDNPWQYDGKEFDQLLANDHIGFVYQIENLTNNRKYIGQKKFWMAKIKISNGKKKRVKATSDWRKYYGSSLELQRDVDTLGKGNFKRTILHLCKSKGDMNFLEMKEQVLRDVLISEEYYNSFVGGKIHSKHLSAETLRNTKCNSH